MKIAGVGCIVFGYLVVSSALNAQGYYYDDVGEVNTYAGVGLGQIGTHGWVGASSGAQFAKYFRGYIDSSYLPLGGRPLRAYDGVVNTSRLYDINFTLKVQIPTRHRFTPYGLASSALLLNTYSALRVYPDGTAQYHGYTDSRFGFEVGGGVRYYFGDDWGGMGEYRYTFSTRNFSRVGTGVFYEFHGYIPFLPRRARRVKKTVEE